MRRISSDEIIPKLKDLILNANFELDPRTWESLKCARKQEVSAMGQQVLDRVLENAEMARKNKMPLCQDTGVAVFFVEWGQDCLLEGLTLQETIDEAVRQAYNEGYLRKSILNDPLFNRSNTGDNTPASIHLIQISGDRVRVRFLAKGTGADNCSQLKMLRPADGLEGVKDFVRQVCKEAGPNACPPWIIGVGIGGTFDTVATLSKFALMRDVGSAHSDANYHQLEQEIVDQLNQTNIGPQGLGGKTTALACFIEARPVHASSLPVAVNIQCHSNRKGMIDL